MCDARMCDAGVNVCVVLCCVVQRHMVDSGKCKILYEENEEEYAEFYGYEGEEEEEEDAGRRWCWVEVGIWGGGMKVRRRRRRKMQVGGGVG